MSDHRPLSPGLRGVLDYGPLAAFLAVFLLLRHQTVHWGGADYPGMIVATVVFVPLTILANAVLWLRTGRLSALQLITLAVVVVFGGLTVWLNDPRFIKMKPTVYYVLIASLLLFGLATGRNLLKMVLGAAYLGLSEQGWKLLTRNWAIFFVVMALVNEAVWRNSSTDFWVGFKLWGALPLTFLFAAANIPMLLRHGLMKEDTVAAEPGPVE